MKLIGLLSLLTAFVIVNSARFIMTKLTDLHTIEVVDGTPLYFRHPTFQTMLSFCMEFAIFAMYAIPAVIFKDKNRATQHYMLTFLYPAICDFIDSQTLNMGMTQISPSLSTMIRTLMCPASALLAYFLLKARFSWGQIGAIVLILKGVFLGCIVQLYYETEIGKFLVTFEGLLLLSLSACLNAFQAILEEQIFRLDPELNPLVLGGAEAFWKIVLGAILIPLYQFIPCPQEVCEGGRLENLNRCIELLTQDKILCTFVIVAAFLSAGTQFLGYMVIKHENAVHKITISLMIIALTWIFFLIYPGKGKEQFSWIVLISILMLFAGSFWFVHADHKQQGIQLMDGRALATNFKEEDTNEIPPENFGFNLKNEDEQQAGTKWAKDPLGARDSEEDALINVQMLDEGQSPVVYAPVKKRQIQNPHLALMSDGSSAGMNSGYDSA